MNVQEEAVRLKTLLDQVYHELDHMESKGMQGYFDKTHDNVTIEQFKKNFNGLREAERQYSTVAPAQKKYWGA